MAPVLKTGEAFRVSVGSNPTPSAPTTRKALLTSANAVRQGLSPLNSVPLAAANTWQGFAALSARCAVAIDQVERRLNAAPSFNWLEPGNWLKPV